MYSLCSDAIATRQGPIEVARAGETTSTSRDAREWVAAGTRAGARAFVAERQSGGVGRQGRPWSSPAGGLWVTLAWPLGADWAAAVDGLGVRVGLACVGAVRESVEGAAPVGLKWPNDVVVGGRKVCGALVEVVQAEGGQRWALVGVGVNANFGRDALPADVRERATTLLEVRGAVVDLDALLGRVLARLAEALSGRGLCEATLAAARGALAGVGRRAAYTLPDGSRAEGTLLGIDDDGHALLRTEDGGVRRLSAGEARE